MSTVTPILNLYCNYNNKRFCNSTATKTYLQLNRTALGTKYDWYFNSGVRLRIGLINSPIEAGLYTWKIYIGDNLGQNAFFEGTISPNELSSSSSSSSLSSSSSSSQESLSSTPADLSSGDPEIQYLDLLEVPAFIANMENININIFWVDGDSNYNIFCQGVAPLQPTVFFEEQSSESSLDCYFPNCQGDEISCISFSGWYFYSGLTINNSDNVRYNFPLSEL